MPNDRTWIGRDGTTPGDFSVPGNWKENSVPVATDNVYVPAGAASMTAGLAQSGLSLGEFIVEPGFSGDLGTDDDFLEISPSLFIFGAIGGTQYVDLGSTSIDVEVQQTGPARDGKRSLYLIGTAIQTFAMYAGAVGIASRAGEVSTATTTRLIGPGNLWLGRGLTLTDHYQTGGVTKQLCASTTAKIFEGQWVSQEDGAITTLQVDGGEVLPNSSGVITNLNHNGGRVDFTRSGVSRTVSNYTPALKNNPELAYDPNVITFTNFNVPSDPYTVQFSRAA